MTYESLARIGNIFQKLETLAMFRNVQPQLQPHLKIGPVDRAKQQTTNNYRDLAIVARFTVTLASLHGLAE